MIIEKYLIISILFVIITTYKNLNYLIYTILGVSLILLKKNNIIIYEELFIETEIIKNIKILIIIILIIIVTLNNINEKELYSLIILSSIGLFIILSSKDLIILYLGIELFSLSGYILAAYKKKDKYSVEGGLKYFILGSISSGILLFGISIIYGQIGTTDIYEMKLIETENIGRILVYIGLLFKIAAVPFHPWIPDVYEGSPTIVTILFALLPKISIIYILNEIVENTNIILISSILSIIIGTLGSLLQFNLKRFYAYTSIVHVGYLLLGIYTINIIGTSIYIIIYIIMGILFFTIYMGFPHDNISINYLEGLYKKNPFIGISLSIYLLSSAGVPPLGGFYSKYFILYEAIENKLYGIIIISIITSVISLFYYLRIIVYTFFKKTNQMYTIKINYISSIIISVTTLLLFVISLYPSIFYQIETRLVT